MVKCSQSEHHALRFYSRYREFFLRYYIFQAKWTRIPILGKLVRAVAMAYGRKHHGAYLLSLEQAFTVIDASTAIALGPCSCRRVFAQCNHPVNAELLIGKGIDLFAYDRPGDYRKITKQEARNLLTELHGKSLLHTLVKCRDNYYALCNCCSCCCVPLRLRRDYGIGSALERDDAILGPFTRVME